MNLNPQFNNFFIRINEQPGYQDRLTELSTMSRFPIFLAIKHQGLKKENPHFHIILQTLQKLGTFRTYLKTKFTEGKGNGHMSIKSWDGNERAIQYLYHEEDCVVLHSKGFTEGFLDEQKIKAQKFTEEKKTYTDSLYEYVMWDILNNGELSDIIDEHQKWSHQRIAYKIWDTCKSQKKTYPNKFLLERMIQKVQAELSQKGLKNMPNWKDQKDSWYNQFFSRE